VAERHPEVEQEQPKARLVGFREFRERGLLLEVNEKVLWPLGLALAINSPLGADGKPDYESPSTSFIVIDYGEPVTMEEVMLKEIRRE